MFSDHAMKEKIFSNKCITLVQQVYIVVTNNGIYNLWVTKLGYKTEFSIMPSQTELLTLKFYYFKFFEPVTQCEKNIIVFRVSNSRFLNKTKFQSY